MENKKPQLIEKEEKVQELLDYFKGASAVVLTDYRGITVAEDTDLRAKMRKAGINYVVAKNTLLKKAYDQINEGLLDEHLNGPTAIAFSQDPVALAKIVSEFISQKKKTTIKAGLLEDRLISAKDIDALAKMPPKEVLLARLLGAMQSPMYGFAGCTAGMLRQLVTVTDRIREQKEAQA